MNLSPNITCDRIEITDYKIINNIPQFKYKYHSGNKNKLLEKPLTLNYFDNLQSNNNFWFKDLIYQFTTNGKKK